METAEVTDQYSYPLFATLEDEEEHEEHENSFLAVICYIILGVIAIAVLAITAGLYFGLHYLNLGQYYSFLHYLKFIIPVSFLIICCLYFWRAYKRGKIEEEDSEPEEENDGSVI